MYPKPARALGKKPQKHEHRAGFPGALGEGTWGSQISNFCGCFVIVKKHRGSTFSQLTDAGHLWKKIYIYISSFGHRSKAKLHFSHGQKWDTQSRTLRRWVHTSLTAPWPGWRFLGSALDHPQLQLGQAVLQSFPKVAFAHFLTVCCRTWGMADGVFLQATLRLLGTTGLSWWWSPCQCPLSAACPSPLRLLTGSHTATQPQTSWEWWCLQLARLLYVNRKEIATVVHGPSPFHLCPISGSHVHTSLEFCCFSSARCPPPWTGRTSLSCNWEHAVILVHLVQL